MTDTIRVNGAAVEFMDEDELTELHARLSFGIRMTGLQGPSLDEAIAAAFGRVVAVIERERGTYAKRRSTIREVFNNDRGNDGAPSS